MKRKTFFTAVEAKKIKKLFPPRSEIWAPIFDSTDDKEMMNIQFLAAEMDSLMRTEDIGFADTHFVFTNDPDGGKASWEQTPDGYAIHLCAKSGFQLDQLIYQLGYTMMHCLIDHLAGDGCYAIPWAEELICKTTALLMLREFSFMKLKKLIGGKDDGYQESVTGTFTLYMREVGNSPFIRSPDGAAFEQPAENAAFEDRIDGTHALLQRMNLADIAELAAIRKYAAEDHLHIYTKYWNMWGHKSEAVRYLCALHDRIAGSQLPLGVPMYIDLFTGVPTAEQIDSYYPLIKNLCNRPNDYIIFEFMDADCKDGEQEGLVFYQVCRDFKDRVRTEVRIDTKCRRTMYQRQSTEEECHQMLKEIIRHGVPPDITDWKDITDDVLHQKEVIRITPEMIEQQKKKNKKKYKKS